MNLKIILSSLFSLSSFFCTASDLDSMMTKEEKKKTGYDSLSKKKKQALEEWIDKHFTPIEKNIERPQLSLSINVQNGKELILSDGSKWAVDPEDQAISGAWLTPFPLKFIKSNSQEYPQFLINLDDPTEKIKVRPIP